MNTESNTTLEEPHPDALLPAENDPIEIKNLALVIITTVVVIYALDWAQSFVITILLGVLLSYTLNPLVKWLEYIKIPRVFGSSIVVLALFACLFFAAFTLKGQVQSIISKLPEASTKLTSILAKKHGETLGSIEKVQMAATQVESATSAVGNATEKKKSPTMHVIVEEPKFKISDFLWRGSLGIFGMVGTVITMAFLAYFLLLSGDTFKRKLVKLTGPSLTRKKITVKILEDINDSIQRYLFMLLVTNMMVGLLMWFALRMVGLENAGAWAVAAAFIHVIPYFGPIVTAIIVGVAAFLQFNSVSMALLTAGISMTIATIIGIFVTTWMTGRIAKMNSAAVFVSLLFFTWLWGVWGMLLGIPIIVIIKVVCVHIEHLQAIAELLGE
ncbi:MAG: AI-2E family transporter [Methylotenera sp.]|nr:AI-2E family transporter [Methylotenera sp.]